MVIEKFQTTRQTPSTLKKLMKHIKEISLGRACVRESQKWRIVNLTVIITKRLDSSMA